MVDSKTSPRRSSRVRQTHPTPSASSHSLSSSSVASSHGERNVRPIKKQQSPQKSATPLSSDGDSAGVKLHLAEPPQTRRRKRGQKSDNEPGGREAAEVEDELIEEEEVTRCVCGQLEYPGPPVEIGESQKAKEGGSQVAGGGSGAHADDGGSLFIQCDICKVWQHGGCVGIMNEATSPEEYFCEQCRKDLHQLKLDSRGQKYSRYLPVFEQLYSKLPRKGMPVRDIEIKANKERESVHLSKIESFTKRRSTMNSRAAYDEDEVLRKVIEESKGEGHTVSMDGSTRKGKRSREDSGEQKFNLKRQRTGSTSPHSHGTSNVYPHDGDSDVEAATRKSRISGRKVKALVPEQGEREIREREKSEAAGRRKGRAERRRGEADYSLSEGVTIKDDVASQQHEDPDPGQYPTASYPAKSSPQHSSNRQSAPKPSRNSKSYRTGRNQYTKDRDNALLRQVSASPALRNKDHSPPTGKASDTDGGHGDGNLHSSQMEAAPYHSRHVKMRNQRSNLNDMRKRVAGMLEFISRVQVDMAQERPSSAASSNLINTNRSAMTMITASFATINGNHFGDVDSRDEESAAGQQNQKMSSQAMTEKPFAELNSLEMMDVLTRKLLRWQKTFGKVGDK